MSTCEKYDLAESHLKSFSRSSIRTKILLCLIEGEKVIGDLEREMKVRPSTILHAIRGMIDMGVVKRTSGGYSLTSIGQVEALLLDNLLGSLVVLDQHRDFWRTHDLSGIPENLLSTIGKLGKAEVMTSNPVDILRTQEFFVKELMKSKSIYGVSPIIIPEYPRAVSVAIENGSDVNLIITNQILDVISHDYYLIMKDMLKSDNFNLYLIHNDVKVAFTVLDEFLSLGLFRFDGRYDIGCDLNCFGSHAKEWGFDLFNHYLSLSKPINDI